MCGKIHLKISYSLQNEIKSGNLIGPHFVEIIYTVYTVSHLTVARFFSHQRMGFMFCISLSQDLSFLQAMSPTHQSACYYVLSHTMHQPPSVYVTLKGMLRLFTPYTPYNSIIPYNRISPIFKLQKHGSTKYFSYITI